MVHDDLGTRMKDYEMRDRYFLQKKDSCCYKGRYESWTHFYKRIQETF